MHISISDIQYGTTIPENNYNLLPVVPSTISPPQKHLSEFQESNNNIENQDYNLVNNYNNNHHNYNEGNDYNNTDNTDNNTDNNTDHNADHNTDHNTNNTFNNTYNNNTDNIIYLSQQQNNVNPHIPTYQKQAYTIPTFSDQHFDYTSNSNQPFHINNNISNVNLNISNDYLIQDNSLLPADNSNYVNYSGQIINHNNPSVFLPQLEITKQFLAPAYSYEHNQFINSAIQNKNPSVDNEFSVNNNNNNNNNNLQKTEPLNLVQSNNIYPSNDNIKNSSFYYNQDKSLQFKNFDEYENKHEIEQQELESVHEHEHEDCPLLINSETSTSSSRKRSDGFLQLSKEDIANEIHNVEIVYKEKLANLLNSEEYKKFANDEKQNSSGSKKRRRFDKIVLECPIKDCKYNGFFKTCDYLKRHIREQHGQNSRLHFCKGFDPITNTYWGCGKSFKRMYQLANHWRGNRSKKKCRVPHYELQKLNIRTNL